MFIFVSKNVCKRETADVCCPQDLRSNWFVMRSLDLTKTFLSPQLRREHTIIPDQQQPEKKMCLCTAEHRFFYYIYTRYAAIRLLPSLFFTFYFPLAYPYCTYRLCVCVCMCTCKPEPVCVSTQFFNSEKIPTIFQWQTQPHTPIHTHKLSRARRQTGTIHSHSSLTHRQTHTTIRTHSCERVEAREEESWKKKNRTQE